MEAGYVILITPHRIVPGGIYVISIVIHYLTEGLFKFTSDGLPVGLMGLILNIPASIIRGSDMIAMILAKYTRLPLGQLLI